MSFVAVAIGAGVSLYGASQAKSSNQDIINNMNNIATAPQSTQLGSTYNYGGTSGLAPSITGGRDDYFNALPNYQSYLTDSTNSYLSNLGYEKSLLGGGAPTQYGSFSLPAPTTNTLAAPNISDFTTTSQEDYLLPPPMSGWGQISTGPQYGTREVASFDQAGYDSALAAYNNSLASAPTLAAQPTLTTQPVTNGDLESRYLKSALDPLRQDSAREIADMRQDFGRRGLSGSSLANNQITNTRSVYGREIGNLTADVEMQQLAARLGIDEAALNAATGLVSNLNTLDLGEQNILTQQAAEELALLGLSSSTTNDLLNNAGLTLQNNQSFYDTLGLTGLGISNYLANDDEDYTVNDYKVGS